MKIKAPDIEVREDFSVAAKNRKKNSSSVNQAAKASKSDMAPAVQEEQAAAVQAASAASAQGTVAVGADDSAGTGTGAVAEATVSVSAKPVAVLSDKNGQEKAMNVAEFGQHVLDNYSVLQSG